MKTIILSSAALANDGGYRDAGTVMTVGDGPDRIAADRAATLVERNLAVAGSAPKRPARTAEKGAA